MCGKKSSYDSIVGLDKSGRARYWTFLVYPDSAPENWRSILDDFHVPWVESPFHDKDINPDGEKKKPHWHIMMYFEGKRSFEQMVNIVNVINSPVPQPVLDAGGLVRYFVHLDNPEKYQYNLLDIIPHQGLDITKYFLPTETQHLAYLHEMFDFIHEQDIQYFSHLVDYALNYKPDTWFVTLTQRYSIFFSKYFTSAAAARRDLENYVPVSSKHKI